MVGIPIHQIYTDTLWIWAFGNFTTQICMINSFFRRIVQIHFSFFYCSDHHRYNIHNTISRKSYTNQLKPSLLTAMQANHTLVSQLQGTFQRAITFSLMLLSQYILHSFKQRRAGVRSAECANTICGTTVQKKTIILTTLTQLPTNWTDKTGMDG